MPCLWATRDVKTTLTVYAHLINTDDHGQHGRARRAGDADDQGRQRDPAGR
jgi:hypothetical protein